MSYKVMIAHMPADMPFSVAAPSNFDEIKVDGATDKLLTDGPCVLIATQCTHDGLIMYYQEMVEIVRQKLMAAGGQPTNIIMWDEKPDPNNRPPWPCHTTKVMAFAIGGDYEAANAYQVITPDAWKQQNCHPARTVV